MLQTTIYHKTIPPGVFLCLYLSTHCALLKSSVPNGLSLLSETNTIFHISLRGHDVSGTRALKKIPNDGMTNLTVLVYWPYLVCPLLFLTVLPFLPSYAILPSATIVLRAP